MRQKLGGVMALSHRPRLVVLDEPTTGVDPVSRAEIARLIAASAADGAAVVFTTSYLDEAERSRGGPRLFRSTAAHVGRRLRSGPGQLDLNVCTSRQWLKP